MGLIKDAFSGTTVVGRVAGDSGSDAASDAADAQTTYNNLALDEIARQFDESSARLQPFVDAGAASLQGVQDASTASGLNDRLAEIMGGNTFSELVSERESSVADQMSRAGLNRSGYAMREAADIPADLAIALESMLFDRMATNVGSAQNAATGLGSLGAGSSSQMAGILQDTGNSIAQGIVGGAQASAASTQNLLNTGLTAAMLFSDPRLKENMAEIGKIETKAGPLTLFEWDWIDGVTDLVGEMNLGFNADEVAERFPHRVMEIHGFKAVDYQGLIEEVKEDLQEAA